MLKHISTLAGILIGVVAEQVHASSIRSGDAFHQWRVLVREQDAERLERMSHDLVWMIIFAP